MLACIVINKVDVDLRRKLYESSDNTLPSIATGVLESKLSPGVE